MGKRKKSPLLRRIEALDKIARELEDWRFDDTTEVQQFLCRQASHAVHSAARMLSMFMLLDK